MRIKERLSQNIPIYYHKVSTWIKSLSAREQGLIAASVAVAIPMFCYSMIYKPLSASFQSQYEELAKLNQDLKAIPHIIDRYSRFKKKREELELEFKQVDITEGEKTFLENILSGKADPGFRIDPLSTTPFGGNYEQASFNIKFSTGNLQNVIDVLTGISTGKKRMLLTSVGISKPRTADKLEVQLSASSIREKKA